jgi:hypothetical protein
MDRVFINRLKQYNLLDLAESFTNILSFNDTIDAARIFKRHLSTLMKRPLLDECHGCPL